MVKIVAYVLAQQAISLDIVDLDHSELLQLLHIFIRIR